jgi:hypothetical protein
LTYTSYLVIIKMDVKITTFKNPFSFFCIAQEDSKNIDEVVESTNSFATSNKIEATDVAHGQVSEP